MTSSENRAALGLILVAVIIGGCVPSRQGYFTRMARRRSEAYRRWRQQRRDDELPQLEGPLYLADAVRLALRHNASLRAALQQKESARGRRLEAHSEVLPSVDLSAEYTRLDKVFTVDLGVESFQVGDQDNYSYRVDVVQPLFKGGSMVIAHRAARLFSYLTDETVRQAVEEVVFAVSQAYYQGVLARQQVEVQRAALKSARAQLDSVEAREEQGVATEFDVLRARVDVSNIQAELIDQKNRLDSARAELLRAMGVSQRSRVELATELEYDREDVPDFREAVRMAFENRPDIYTAAINYDLQQEAYRNAHTSYLPNLEAYFWNLWAKPDPHESSNITWDTQWQYGLRLRWSLFDGLAREGQIIQERALMRERGIELADAEQKALKEVRDAMSGLESARELVESQKLNLRRADRALALVEAGYQEGVNTELEVLDARSALTRARGLYYTALHRHTMARIHLQRAVGVLGPRPGSREVPEEAPEIGSIQSTREGAP